MYERVATRPKPRQPSQPSSSNATTLLSVGAFVTAVAAGVTAAYQEHRDQKNTAERRNIEDTLASSKEYRRSIEGTLRTILDKEPPNLVAQNLHRRLETLNSRCARQRAKHSGDNKLQLKIAKNFNRALRELHEDCVLERHQVLERADAAAAEACLPGVPPPSPPPSARSVHFPSDLSDTESEAGGPGGSTIELPSRTSTCFNAASDVGGCRGSRPLPQGDVPFMDMRQHPQRHSRGRSRELDHVDADFSSRRHRSSSRRSLRRSSHRWSSTSKEFSRG